MVNAHLCDIQRHQFQVPQFILDSLILSGHGAEASIVVTQPRRISAVSVAARVSAERIDDGSVGYTVRGDTKHGQATKLLFCTTGVVLRRLGSGDGLKDVTHIVVDEVHDNLDTMQRTTLIAHRFTNVLSMEIFFFWNSKSC